MRKILIAGAASAVGVVIGACGSADSGTPTAPTDGGAGNSSGGSSGGKGTGGSSTGGRNGGSGAGGSSGAGGGDASTGRVRCGTVLCASVTVSPGLEIEACCPAGTSNRCGLNVSAVASAVGLSAGCIETGQAGTDDATCPATPAPSGFDGGPSQFPGCCTPNGVCGVRVDLDSIATGLDFGCAAASLFPEAGAPKSCGQDASPVPDASPDAAPDAAPEASTGGLPLGCPGVIGDYMTIVSGTAGDDTFGDQTQKVVILGLAGNDTFNPEVGQSNCLVGGPGNDRFLYGAEGSEQTFVGGPGNDVFFINQGPFGSQATIFDLNVEGDDEIHLNLSGFGLTGTAGSTASATEVVVIPDHNGGGFPTAAGAAARVGYDPTDGEIWADTDGSGQAISRKVGTVTNHPAFDINDYKLE